MKITGSHTIEFLGFSYYLTFEGSLIGTPPVLYVGSLFSYSLETLEDARVDDQLIDNFFASSNLYHKFVSLTKQKTCDISKTPNKVLAISRIGTIVMVGWCDNDSWD